MIGFARAAAFATACFTFATANAAQEVADRIWSGGPILTMNDKAMRAEAVAERDGRIIAVGKRADVMKTRGPNTEVIELKGRALLPGFVDAHGHVLGGGLQALSANLLAPPDGDVKDIASLQKRLREWMAANEAIIKRVNLVIGFGYDPSTMVEQRHPTRDDLDAVARDVPIMVVHQSAHLVAANSKALEVAGITAATPDPAGGVIRRRSGSQEPDGVLEETAAQPMMAKLLGQIGPEGVKAFLQAGAEMWARFGYTTAQEGRATPGSMALIRKFAESGELKIDVVAYPDVLVDREFIKKNVGAAYTNRVRIAGAKLTIDGSPQGFTAWRDRPYYKPVGDYAAGYRGYPAATPDQVVDAINWAYASDVQILTHANGEAAQDLLIAALTLAELKNGAGKDRRPVLIHGQFMREDQVDDYWRLGVIPSLFPMHTFYWGDWHLDHTVGPQLGQNISPTGWVRRRGMIFTSHHDAPVAFPDSMRVLNSTVTRKARGSGRIVGPQQRVDVITGLKSMTLWPAYQHFEEASKGSIEPGKLADFVILSRDPTQGRPDAIDQIKVAETIKEGRTIFRLTPQEQRKADLVLKPDHRGDDAFARFLTTSAAHRDRAALPPDLQSRGTLAYFAGAPHDAVCLADALGELIAAMVGSESEGMNARGEEPVAVR